MLRILLYVLILAGLIYTVFWVIGRRNDPPPHPTTRGPVGPDDDEEFLRDLERKRRHREAGES